MYVCLYNILLHSVYIYIVYKYISNSKLINILKGVLPGKEPFDNKI